MKCDKKDFINGVYKKIGAYSKNGPLDRFFECKR